MPVLDLMPPDKQLKIKGLLGYNPSTAGGLMSPDFVAVPREATVAKRWWPRAPKTLAPTA